MQTPPACATPPPRDTVHSSDLRLGFEYRQPVPSACLAQAWRFHLCGRVRAVCMPLTLRRELMHDACCCYPGILGNRYSSIRGGMHGPQGGYGVSIYDLCQRSAL